MQILLVEDDHQLGASLTEALTDKGYLVDWRTDGEQGWLQASVSSYAVIILDVMLPKLDGIQLCQRLRKRDSSVPILMLTARDTNSDKVTGLDAGADDYVVKPFDLLELLARLRALIRRSSLDNPNTVLSWQQITLDPAAHQAFYGKTRLSLTPKEFNLLTLFLHNGKRVLSRAVVMEECWPADAIPDEATVKSHIKRLRQKLRKAGAPKDVIETIHGVGYRLK